MTYARRVDAPHKAVMQALRKTGWLVMDTSRLKGWCDLVAYHVATGELRLVEVKALKGRFTEAQIALADAGWPIVTCRSVEQALRLLET